MSDDFREAWHAAVEMCREKQSRIEQLEKALRTIATLNLYPAQYRERARAALAEGQDK